MGLDDPLAAFPIFKKYDRNGLNLQIACKRVSTLNPISVEWAYELTTTNMQKLYEVQLESRVRRKGLGKFLIQILQLIANRFEIDDTSPSMSGCCGDDCTYEILSRRTKHAEALGHSHGGGGHCGGCCH
ncbi:N-alpha-acetyltransferase 40 isoform X2 [Oncorhynchus kisutch]|uniref:N-alpha-acetyltransferase 40 isoform X2 n=1 Tax=Oncorhynchus kisutch TaxID=8019 RepID=UPI0009A07D75|nr:N-alpha-acetyltransferase 40 isoform X2 [Oncorhynchus kisutch]